MSSVHGRSVFPKKPSEGNSTVRVRLDVSAHAGPGSTGGDPGGPRTQESLQRVLREPIP